MTPELWIAFGAVCLVLAAELARRGRRPPRLNVRLKRLYVYADSVWCETCRARLLPECCARRHIVTAIPLPAVERRPESVGGIDAAAYRRDAAAALERGER